MTTRDDIDQLSEPPRSGLPSRRLLVAVILLATGWAAALLWLDGDRQETPTARAAGLQGSKLPEGLDKSPAPTFNLTDARGGTLTSEELRGRPYAVTFLFTRCPDVCPMIGQELRASLDELGTAASKVAVVAISVDPRGDTPAAVRSWLDRQRLPQNFHYAIGSRQRLAPVWKKYYAAPLVEGRPETGIHTAAVWLVDSRGRLRTRYPASEPLPLGSVAGDFRTLLAEAAGDES